MTDTADELPPLETEVRRRITASGAMPVAQYMTLCLTHPQLGYYVTRDPIGAKGDFVTAPEISQMFGELVGLWGGRDLAADGIAGEHTPDLVPAVLR